MFRPITFLRPSFLSPRINIDPSSLSLITSLVEYWKANEASGTLLGSLGAHDLTDTNTVTSAAGLIGTARQYTRANQEYFVKATPASLQAGDFDFSYWTWLYLDTNGIFQDFAGLGVPFGNNAWRARVRSANDVRFSVWHDGATEAFVTSSTTLGTGAWNLIGVWHDAAANTINVKINNGTTVSAAHTLGVLAATGNFYHGAYTDASLAVNGRMDESGYATKVLSAAEWTYLYNGGAGRTYSGGLFV